MSIAELSAVRCLAPRGVNVSEVWPQLLMASSRTAPFAPQRIAALDQISKAIFRHPHIRREPSSAALAYWLRAVNIEQLRRQWQSHVDPGITRAAAGLVFHITPANVDTMFMYSWALAFLAGNANAVRLSTAPSKVLNELVTLLDTSMNQDPVTWTGNVFLTYEHNDAVTRLFSQVCDHRVIWGGDETVARIRAVPLNPHASERAFASKFSCAVIAVDAFLVQDEAAQRALAKRLLGDIQPFGQMACSSPHVIYWLGEDRRTAVSVASHFELIVSEILNGGAESDDVALAVHRTNQAFLLAADGLGGEGRFHPGLTSVQIEEGVAPERLKVGGNFLSHRFITRLDELASETDRRTQTISHHGLTEEELHRLVALAGARGCDRLVPIGRALEFGAYWDGYDLWSDFSRSVSVCK